MEQNKEQQPTIEEVLKKHTGGDLRFVLRQMVLDAMQEWASIETEQLRQENKTLIQRIKDLEKIINQKPTK